MPSDIHYTKITNPDGSKRWRAFLGFIPLFPPAEQSLEDARKLVNAGSMIDKNVKCKFYVCTSKTKKGALAGLVRVMLDHLKEVMEDEDVELEDMFDE